MLKIFEICGPFVGPRATGRLRRRHVRNSAGGDQQQHRGYVAAVAHSWLPSLRCFLRVREEKRTEPQRQSWQRHSPDKKC